jgi:hypothetical protein
MDALFSWKFQSRFERGKQWYIIAATIIISATVVSFLVGEYFLGIVLILFAGVYLLYDVNSHPEVNVEIGPTGIAVDNLLYGFDRIESFGIMRVENIPLIMRLKVTTKTIGFIDLYLDPSLDLELMRQFIGNYIPENPPADISTLERLFLGLRL